MLTVVPFPIKFKNSDTLKGEIMDPSYTQDLRNRPEKHPETPTDAILIINGSRQPVHKVILAAQSDFFEGLFTFMSFEDKKEFNITTPNIHPYLTEENFKLVLDTFYEIEHDFDEEKALEMIVLGNYFLAPYLTKKSIGILINQMDRDGDDGHLWEFAQRYQLEELKTAIIGDLKNMADWE